MKSIRRSVSILLSLIMIVSLFTIIPFEAGAAGAITIYEHHWDSTDKKVISDPISISNYTELSDRESDVLYDGYYTVTKNTTVQGRLVVYNGEKVGIYLGSNATLTGNGGICVKKGGELNIYVAASKSGSLVVNTNNGSTSRECASIGSDAEENGGTINIHGGSIEVTAKHGARGAQLRVGRQGEYRLRLRGSKNIQGQHLRF